MMVAEPKPAKNCVVCGVERPADGSRQSRRDESGTRMPEGVWLVSLARDPFCSTECCRDWYGIGKRDRCVDCGKVRHRNASIGERCGSCGDKHYAAIRRETRRAANKTPGRCVGCGGAYTDATSGCYQCADRLRRRTPESRKKRNERNRERYLADPEYRERRKALKRAQYQRKLAAARAGADRAATSPAALGSGGIPLDERKAA